MDLLGYIWQKEETRGIRIQKKLSQNSKVVHAHILMLLEAAFHQTHGISFQFINYIINKWASQISLFSDLKEAESDP